jgi:hypothetical protein
MTKISKFNENHKSTDPRRSTDPKHKKCSWEEKIPRIIIIKLLKINDTEEGKTTIG